MPRFRRKLSRAFTLLEALLAASVLAITVMAITMPFTAGMRTQAAEARQTVAVSLAEELMEEVLQKPFEEPDDGDEAPEDGADFGPDVGESTRSDYSAIDDYHGYVESAGAIQDPEGELMDDPASAGLSRHVTVTYVYVSGQDPAGDPSFLRVIVEVRCLDEPLVTLTRLVHWLN